MGEALAASSPRFMQALEEGVNGRASADNFSVRERMFTSPSHQRTSAPAHQRTMVPGPGAGAAGLQTAPRA
ncbi:hypothetical protein SNOG_12249 [Parastagonospora nodorum SN15]|uniref:Uncharacterized protein n=1 Tax=Phaeosphaeria nodorum (strain SN15 / ATCC MYA-4574 / FGSC 10173) TaxID=321614 RepID=Q0U7L5_PHANO|nr:hypothetical protein SNOG_12249 [Parastagonospora nodorum SN15]EAT80661.1 hypothetical protein SNOG_12249 [Parastagonospora nodorum SN15]